MSVSSSLASPKVNPITDGRCERGSLQFLGNEDENCPVELNLRGIINEIGKTQINDNVYLFLVIKLAK